MEANSGNPGHFHSVGYSLQMLASNTHRCDSQHGRAMGGTGRRPWEPSMVTGARWLLAAPCMALGSPSVALHTAGHVFGLGSGCSPDSFPKGPHAQHVTRLRERQRAQAVSGLPRDWVRRKPGENRSRQNVNGEPFNCAEAPTAVQCLHESSSNRSLGPPSQVRRRLERFSPTAPRCQQHGLGGARCVPTGILGTGLLCDGEEGKKLPGKEKSFLFFY